MLATYTYNGPPIATCGNPTLTLRNSGTVITFLAFSYNSATNLISVTLPDSTVAVKGTYVVDAVVSSPGTFTFPLGLTLSVIDSCNPSTFPSAPSITPNLNYYYVGATSG